MLNFNLSDDQKAVRDRAREFALREILPIAAYYDDKNTTPENVLRKAYEAGLMNSDIPVKYGGKGYGLVEAALLTEEIAAACSGLATSIFDNSLGFEPIMLSDNEKLKERYLPLFARGEKYICFATSEPSMGSDVAGIRCRAEKKGNDYILNGTKYWITNAGVADYMTVFATVDPKSRHDGICAFIVDRNWEGVSVGRHIPKMGQRASNTAGISLKNVLVPAENVLAEPGKGFVLAMKTFGRTRPIIGAFGVGAARSAMEFAIDYVKKRQSFGMPLSGYQGIQFKLAEIYQKIETSRLLVWRSAWQADQGKDPTVHASVAKMYATEACWQAANDALQVIGGYGYTKMFPFEKIVRDLRLLMIYEGTSEVQRVILGAFTLGAYRPVMPPLEDLPWLRTDSTDGEFDEAMKGKTGWRCRICGHIHYGDTPPDECPYCFFPATAFKKVWPREK